MRRFINILGSCALAFFALAYLYREFSDSRTDLQPVNDAISETLGIEPDLTPSWELEKLNNPIDGPTLEASIISNTDDAQLLTTISCAESLGRLRVNFQINDLNGETSLRFVRDGHGLKGRIKGKGGETISGSKALVPDTYNNVAALVNQRTINNPNFAYGAMIASALGASEDELASAYTNVAGDLEEMLPLNVELSSGVGEVYFIVPDDEPSVVAVIRACPLSKEHEAAKQQASAVAEQEQESRTEIPQDPAIPAPSEQVEIEATPENSDSTEASDSDPSSLDDPS